jgi:ABC-2 type transport system permease protein
MGLAQAFLLTVVPWLVMLLVCGSASKTYPFSQMGFHVFLLWSGGMVFVALAVLISSIVEGQYTAPVVSIGISVLLVNALKAERLNPYSPWTFMGGMSISRGVQGSWVGNSHCCTPRHSVR